MTVRLIQAVLFSGVQACFNVFSLYSTHTTCCIPERFVKRLRWVSGSPIYLLLRRQYSQHCHSNHPVKYVVNFGLWSYIPLLRKFSGSQSLTQTRSEGLSPYALFHDGVIQLEAHVQLVLQAVGVWALPVRPAQWWPWPYRSGTALLQDIIL